ncbi:MAG: membrane dipeptidase, partial [Clostridium sp.]
NVGGADVISIGSDFDGINPKNLEISSMAEMYKLTNALEAHGFKPEDIDKILYKNALRVIKDVL